MAGTIPGFSLAQMLDSDGTPLVGGKLYTIQAGTTSTPQTAYQDSGLTLPLSYPIICDAYGRLPHEPLLRFARRHPDLVNRHCRG